jgi:hypothetical protein
LATEHAVARLNALSPHVTENLMIARIWRGTVREADKDTYHEYLKATGLKEYASIPGNRGSTRFAALPTARRNSCC